MAGIGSDDEVGERPGRPSGDGLAVREPRQRRTREQWTGVLDAGVRLLERGGYAGFTVAALCEEAGVPPRALYARADSKDALFLAVYDHAMVRVRAGHAPYGDEGWAGLDEAARIGRAVGVLVEVFTANTDLLRAVVLTSGVHPEVHRRGAAHRAELGGLFCGVLAGIAPARVLDLCFEVLFSALVVRVAYGDAFGGGLDGGTADDLGEVARRVLGRG